MPILQPSARHNADSAQRRDYFTPEIKELHIEECSVATFIIQETKNFKQKLQYQSNGKFTKLGKHVLECSTCRGENVSLKKEETLNDNEFQLLKIHKEILKSLDKWRFQNHRTQDLDQCVQLLIMEHRQYRQIIQDLNEELNAIRGNKK